MTNSSEYPGPILTYFTGLIVVQMGMIIPKLVWRSPKTVAVATDFVKKWQTPHFCHSGIQNGMRYCYLNVRTTSTNDACI